jgi:hypothetical protein
LNTIT